MNCYVRRWAQAIKSKTVNGLLEQTVDSHRHYEKGKRQDKPQTGKDIFTPQIRYKGLLKSILKKTKLLNLSKS